MEQSELQERICQLKKFARKSRDIRMKQRYDAVRLTLEGRKMAEVAKILDITYHTVRNYMIAYDEKGIEGLNITKPPGRATKLTQTQEKALYHCIVSNLPKDVGFAPFVNWTSPLACQWVLNQFDVKFSDRGMRNLFKRLGLSFTCPTYTLAKANPEKQQEFLEEFDVLKKTDFWRD